MLDLELEIARGRKSISVCSARRGLPWLLPITTEVTLRRRSGQANHEPRATLFIPGR
jgi:hypothetical protein